MTQTLAPAPKSCTCGAGNLASCLCGTTAHDWFAAEQAKPAKLTAVEKREAFLASVAKPINDHFKAAQMAKQLGQPFPEQPAPEVYTEAARRYAEEGPALGRTTRWQNACAWPQAEIDIHPGDAAHARWAVLQGSVYLAHAAD